MNRANQEPLSEPRRTAGASGIKPASGAPIITSNTRVTIAKTPEAVAKWQNQPGQSGPFAGLGIGRYLA